MSQQREMQIQVFFQVAKIGGGQPAIDKVESLAGPGVQHAQRVFSAGGAGEFYAHHAMTSMPQPFDDAGNSARFAGVHGSAAYDYDTGARLKRCGRQRKLAETQLAAILPREETEQAQFAGFAHAIVFALNEAANTRHAEKIAAFSVRLRISLELHRRVAVSEDAHHQVADVQGATPSARQFQICVSSDFLYLGQCDVSRLRRFRTRQEA